MTKLNNFTTGTQEASLESKQFSPHTHLPALAQLDNVVSHSLADSPSRKARPFLAGLTAEPQKHSGAVLP